MKGIIWGLFEGVRGDVRQVWSCCYDYKNDQSQGKGSQGNPPRPIRDY